MPRELPFDEETMTLIMGLGDPGKPGQHGRNVVPAPENKAIDVITQIRDLCEDFLQSADKGEDKPEGGEEKPDKPEDAPEDEAPMPEDEEEEKR